MQKMVPCVFAVNWVSLHASTSLNGFLHEWHMISFRSTMSFRHAETTWRPKSLLGFACGQQKTHQRVASCQRICHNWCLDALDPGSVLPLCHVWTPNLAVHPLSLAVHPLSLAVYPVIYRGFYALPGPKWIDRLDYHHRFPMQFLSVGPKLDKRSPKGDG